MPPKATKPGTAVSVGLKSVTSSQGFRQVLRVLLPLGVVAGVVVLVLVLWYVNSPEVRPIGTAGCDQDVSWKCEDGAVCISGVCKESVSALGADCSGSYRACTAEGAICVDSYCRQPVGIGQSCTAEHSHCISGSLVACASDATCADGEVCASGRCQIPVKCANGVCTRLAMKGEPCQSQVCQDGLECIDGRCSEQVPQGAMCNDEQHCDADRNRCYLGVCQPVLEDGQQGCSGSDLSGVCKLGSQCDDGTCKRVVSRGQVCDADSTLEVCADSLECLSGKCVDVRLLGQSCNEDPWQQCDGDLTCDRGTCKQRQGGQCMSTSDCTQGLECHAGMCATVAGLSEMCGLTTEDGEVVCQQPLVCDSATAMCLKPTGELCQRGSTECSSGNVCKEGPMESRCVSVRNLGEACTGSNVECADGLRCDGATCVQNCTAGVCSEGCPCQEGDQCQYSGKEPGPGQVACTISPQSLDDFRFQFEEMENLPPDEVDEKMAGLQTSCHNNTCTTCLPGECTAACPCYVGDSCNYEQLDETVLTFGPGIEVTGCRARPTIMEGPVGCYAGRCAVAPQGICEVDSDCAEDETHGMQWKCENYTCKLPAACPSSTPPPVCDSMGLCQEGTPEDICLMNGLDTGKLQLGQTCISDDACQSGGGWEASCEQGAGLSQSTCRRPWDETWNAGSTWVDKITIPGQNNKYFCSDIDHYMTDVGICAPFEELRRGTDSVQCQENGPPGQSLGQNVIWSEHEPHLSPSLDACLALATVNNKEAAQWQGDGTCTLYDTSPGYLSAGAADANAQCWRRLPAAGPPGMGP